MSQQTGGTWQDLGKFQAIEITHLLQVVLPYLTLT
jgi:hypothetical protein